ncbi:hypothetical protein L484_012402 [Morus notabilis]|uniref:Uncharacterized protein n=1 Tax=Morus notabilis TaxID=981085 RepID=W9QED6_9ROSA|nr:hypothetical protein L484_012402 [Morus notabilis]
MVKHVTLVQLMDLAQKVEDKNWALERAQVGRFLRHKPTGERAGLNGERAGIFRDYYGPQKSAVGESFVSGSSWTPPKFSGNTKGLSEMTRVSSTHSSVSVNKDPDTLPSHFTRKNDILRRTILDAEM